jgi:hypothetical protein
MSHPASARGDTGQHVDPKREGRVGIAGVQQECEDGRSPLTERACEMTTRRVIERSTGAPLYPYTGSPLEDDALAEADRAQNECEQNTRNDSDAVLSAERPRVQILTGPHGRYLIGSATVRGLIGPGELPHTRACAVKITT